MLSQSPKHDDPYYMHIALSLARKSRPSPNPRVGAVIVKDHKIVGQGYHVAPGAPHAEIVALEEAKEKAAGADLYVTLEPCCHHGRTGPCTHAIHSAAINRIIVGMVDPDKQVQGQGIQWLKRKGHPVTTGILQTECRDLLEAYAYHRTHGKPFVTLKAATTLDGYIATDSGDSKWITGTDARKRVHQIRAEYDAILVGIETVLADNPLLTVRNAAGPNPKRVIVDSRLRIPLESQLVQTAKHTPVYIAYCHPDTEKETRLCNMVGVHLLRCEMTSEGRVNITHMLHRLFEQGVLSVFVEGGGQIHGAFVKTHNANKLHLFIAPKLIGSGRKWASFPGVPNLKEATLLQNIQHEKIGSDILITGYFNN